MKQAEKHWVEAWVDGIKETRREDMSLKRNLVMQKNIVDFLDRTAHDAIARAKEEIQRWEKHLASLEPVRQDIAALEGLIGK